MNRFLTAAALLALTTSGGAFAQEQDKEATLEINAGSVMASEGGDFVSAPDGKALMEGQRVMVTEGSRATLVYENGCRDELLEPGVYEVDDENCAAAVLLTDAGSTHLFGVGAVPFLITTAGVIAIMLSGDDDNDGPIVPPPPVSP